MMLHCSNNTGEKCLVRQVQNRRKVNKSLTLKQVDSLLTLRQIFLFLSLSIYICAVKLKAGPRFGGFKVENWSKLKVKYWSKFLFTVFPVFIVFFGVCSKTQIVSLCAKIVFSRNCLGVKNEVFKYKSAFFGFVFVMLLQEKQTKNTKKMETAQKPIKIVFLRWLSKNEKRIIQKMFFFFLQKMPDTICVRKGEKLYFRSHYLFWPNCFGPKQ